MRRALACSLVLLALVAGCDDPSPKAPAKTEDDTRPQAPGKKGVAPPSSRTRGAAPVKSTTRDLDAILIELEEIEAMTPNLEDPDADHEARFERVLDLAVEAAGFGLKALPKVHARLVESRKLPKEVGYLQRSDFLARVFARLASGEPPALEETAKLLHTLKPAELQAAFVGLPRGKASAVLRGWLAQLSSPPGPNEGPLRLAVLERYLKVETSPDRSILKTLTQDPDAKVAAAAAEFVK